jgi:1,4-alpha-glucan branching enzyme
MDLLPIERLGAVIAEGTASFSLWLPWVSPTDGFRLFVKIIRAQDQFLQAVPPREFELVHEIRAPHGDFWSTTVAIARDPGDAVSTWGSPGTYVYRFLFRSPGRPDIDWILDPFAREFATGKMCAFTIGAQAYRWSDGESSWRTPALADLVIYEIDLAEFGGNLTETRQLLAYLRDLGVNAIEVMPLSNVADVVDWGYLPIGYFGVDERFGTTTDLQQLVDVAHQHGIAVIADAVYGHTGVDFPYFYVYDQLGYRENPFMGPFSKDYFSAFGKSTDYNRLLTQDFFFTVNAYWLDVFHVDGLRYDCVPNYWDGPVGNGYANLVYRTRELTRSRVAAGTPYWTRFGDPNGAALRLIQCAEQLEGPEEILNTTCSNSTWQDRTFDAAKGVARGDQGRITDLGLSLGLFGYPDQVTTADGSMQKSALQYIENHDHERFICNFGLTNPDEAGNSLFAEGDRGRWFKLQPYLIALLLSKGIPLLWQGQELGENYWLPDFGEGRVAILRPLRWDLFYDDAGKGLVGLVRNLLRIRKARAHIRSGEYFFFNDWDRYLSKNLLLFARYRAADYSLVAINFSDVNQTVPFWFPIAGTYREELHGGPLDLPGVAALAETWITVPPNYGRVWTNGARTASGG